MQRIAINTCYGGFRLSDKAKDLYKAKSGVDKDDEVYDWDIERDDPDLIEVIEELGEEAEGDNTKLKIVEIPDGVKWMIEEYDGWNGSLKCIGPGAEKSAPFLFSHLKHMPL